MNEGLEDEKEKEKKKERGNGAKVKFDMLTPTLFFSAFLDGTPVPNRRRNTDRTTEPPPPPPPPPFQPNVNETDLTATPVPDFLQSGYILIFLFHLPD